MEEKVLIAWDGTPEDFWRSVQAMVLGTDIESDHAVVGEVLDLALEKGPDGTESKLRRTRGDVVG